MKLPKYITIAPAHDLPGAGFILHTEEPRIFARIFKFKRQDEHAVHMANFNGTARACIPGYSIDLVYAGSIGLIRATPETKDQINHILSGMISYYLEKIKTEPGKFTKFRL